MNVLYFIILVRLFQHTTVRSFEPNNKSVTSFIQYEIGAAIPRNGTIWRRRFGDDGLTPAISR